jgi:hypothetical protein
MFAAFAALVALIPLLEVARAGAYLWLGALFVAALGFMLSDRDQSPT